MQLKNDYSIPDVSQVELFRAVIQNALQEALSKNATSAAQKQKREAIAWFDPENEDFCLVCELAQINPILTCREALKRITKNSKK
jgi:hypothetical protein